MHPAWHRVLHSDALSTIAVDMVVVDMVRSLSYEQSHWKVVVPGPNFYGCS